MKQNIIGLTLAVLIILFACVTVTPLPAQEPVLNEETCIDQLNVALQGIVEFGDVILNNDTDDMLFGYWRAHREVVELEDSDLRLCNKQIYIVLLQIQQTRQDLYMTGVLDSLDIEYDKQWQLNATWRFNQALEDLKELGQD